MRTIQLNKKSVEIYDAIDELPVDRFHKFNKCMLIDSGIGSDLNDINSHIAKALRYVDLDPKKAKATLENLRQSLFLVAEERSVKHLSFAVLVHKIDGRQIFDFTDEGLVKTLAKLGDAPTNKLEQVLASVKKKKSRQS